MPIGMTIFAKAVCFAPCGNPSPDYNGAKDVGGNHNDDMKLLCVHAFSLDAITDDRFTLGVGHSKPLATANHVHAVNPAMTQNESSLAALNDGVGRSEAASVGSSAGSALAVGAVILGARNGGARSDNAALGVVDHDFGIALGIDIAGQPGAGQEFNARHSDHFFLGAAGVNGLGYGAACCQDSEGCKRCECFYHTRNMTLSAPQCDNNFTRKV